MFNFSQIFQILITLVLLPVVSTAIFISFSNVSEGQKKAIFEEWDGREKKSADGIADLKKEIKELTASLISYINVADGKYSDEASCEAIRTVNYPIGADSAAKALEIYDLQIINQTKKYDLLEAEFVRRKEHFHRLQRERAESIAIQNAECGSESQTKDNSSGGGVGSGSRPKTSGQNRQFRSNYAPLTVEEDENRKLICHLENEIIRINMQWSQAEHIRKKYKAIQASLMTDAEKFEKNLLELEEALRQQNGDIEKMKVRKRRFPPKSDRLGSKVLLLHFHYFPLVPG